MFVNSLKNRKEYIDCHSHLSFLCDQSLESVSQLLKDVVYVQGGYNLRDFRNQISFLQKLNQVIVPCLGLHPWHVNQLSRSDLEKEIQELREEFKNFDQGLILIGETGLDSAVKDLNLDRQLESFREHIKLALESETPLVLHSVQSHGRIIEELEGIHCKGIVHGFSGTKEVADRYIQCGFLISIGPSLLNPKYKKLNNAIREISLDQMVLESDWPDHFSGAETVQVDVFQVAHRVAELKGVATEQVLQACTENFRQMLDK